MRKLTRSILAAGTVAGLLAIPVVGAGAADGSTATELTLNSATGGVLAITVPDSSTNPVNLGSVEVSNGASLTSNGLGQVTVSDSRTGLIRTINLSTATQASDGAVPVAFCQSADADLSDGVTCDGDANTTIALAQAIYNFNTVTETGDATVTGTGAVGGVLGTAGAVWAATPGVFTESWTPTFDITLLGTELAGTYYGAVQHSVS